MSEESAIFESGAAGTIRQQPSNRTGSHVIGSYSRAAGWTRTWTRHKASIACASSSFNPAIGAVKNYRQHPEYKSAASGLRFPFTPRALSGWYVPSPDLSRRFWPRLNGRNAEYSANYGPRLSRPAPEPDREEKGLGLN